MSACPARLIAAMIAAMFAAHFVVESFGVGILMPLLAAVCAYYAGFLHCQSKLDAKP